MHDTQTAHHLYIKICKLSVCPFLLSCALCTILNFEDDLALGKEVKDAQAKTYGKGPGRCIVLPTSSMVSRMALGFPGRFRMSDLPRKPAVCRDNTAVGTCLRCICCLSRVALIEQIA